ncbi:dethiobiotin synthase [Vibrio sp.]|nr:dethiobiotin synthase [Vibrio sp.]
MSKCLFIAGTDTDVGKTVVSIAMMRYFKKQNMKVVGYKPVAAGAEYINGHLRNNDALLLHKESNIEIEYESVNPFVFQEAASPHIAAKRSNTQVDCKVLNTQLEALTHLSDRVIVEGAGGWHVPISDNTTLDAWVIEQDLEVVLVVGIKLGCLNHALLTMNAIVASGLTLRGWVANSLNESTENYEEMVLFLKQHITAPLIGEVPFIEGFIEKDSYLDFDMKF